MNDHADKSYLADPLPDTPQARAAAVAEKMGRKHVAHPSSTFVYSKEPVVLTAWTRKRELAKFKRRAA